MFSLHFTRALLERVTQKPKEDSWKPSISRSFEGVKLVTLDLFKHTPQRWSPWAQGGNIQPHAGEKGIWLIPVVPSSIPSQPGHLAEAAKAPKQKLPEPGSRRRCVLLAAEGVYLPCARIMTKFYPRNTQLVWLDPQAYLLGKTVRFKEHTIPIRCFFFFF